MNNTLSHVVGVLVTPPTALVTGPDSGSTATSANTWTLELPSAPIPDTKFFILHFTNANLPGNNRVEVDLGYDTDVFKAADGQDFWTRPINVKALAGAPVVIRYITDGATTGGIQLKEYGRGERHAGHQDPTSLSNCDPFFTTPTYTEPKYDPFWYSCDPTGPHWENIGCVTDTADVRARVSRSVGMTVSVEDQGGGVIVVSTCTATLIDSDQIITAGHCFTPAEALTSSITFDYQTDCGGNRLPNYNPKFYKFKEVLDHQWDGTNDFSRVRLKTNVPNVPSLQMRPDIPGVGEQIFGVHHPNGAVKKLSFPHPTFATVAATGALSIQVPAGFDVSGGSSGSPLIDAAGRVVGVLSRGNECAGFLLIYYPTSSILKTIAPLPPAPITRDVMVVFDHSGSMSELDSTGRTKIEVARDAVSLFVQLVRSGVGNRLGLVSFSTSASSPVDFPITNVDTTSKPLLIGAPPFSGGKVGALVPNGATSIGDGLEKARLQFPVPGANPRALLLMTDGMENTAPFISNVQGALTDIDIHAVGFGTDANLNGPLLSQLTTNHNGLYTRAESGVSLQKFFSHAFGNIFETGILHDPEFDLPEKQNASRPLSFNVCGEDAITVAVGWDKVNTTLLVRLTSPNGATIVGGSTDVEQSSGRTWTFLRVPLPHGGERDGIWNATVFRPSGSSFAPLHYFINVIPTGGARLRQVQDGHSYYTGDVVNPLVYLTFSDGSWPATASVQVSLSRPNASIGTILSQAGLKAPLSIAGDTIPARQATLGDRPAISFVDEDFELFREANNTNFVFEETALFGNFLSEKLVTEGDYTFHFRATYGSQSCTATRELLRTIHVDVGIDPSHTDISFTFTNTLPNGQRTGFVTLIPRDKYGNGLGPGRSDGVTISGSGGTSIRGPVSDKGNGTYTIPVGWNPDGGNPPGVVIEQPGRPPVLTQQPGSCTTPPHDGGGSCKCKYPNKNKCKRNNGGSDNHCCCDDDDGHHDGHKGDHDNDHGHKGGYGDAHDKGSDDKHKSRDVYIHEPTTSNQDLQGQMRNIESEYGSTIYKSYTNMVALSFIVVFSLVVVIKLFRRFRGRQILSVTPKTQVQEVQPLISK